jgi:hypothetical protein
MKGSAALIGFGLLWVAMSAQGVTCYQIWNAQDVMSYQSVNPPFELAGPDYAASMVALRAKHSQLIFFDSVACEEITTTVATPAQGRPAADPSSLLVTRPMGRLEGIAGRNAIWASGGAGAAPPAAGAPSPAAK